MLRLYEFNLSGNCYKVRLLMMQLEIAFERVELDFIKKENRNIEFLNKNPQGRVPVLELESGEFLLESNAIMFYLSKGTQLFPDDHLEQSKVMQWLFFEQYSLMPYIGPCRYWMTILNKANEFHDVIAEKQKSGYAALSVMEQHLHSRDFFVGNRYTIADICLFAYTHIAHEGGYNIFDFSAIQAWIERVKSQPHYINIS
ncbi:MAG: glutathione S-transferase family protein [Scytonema sp. PMC 1070.18]|nr:glutathione S-transferase family protein [Scytonema sp. PMC 1070.18]